MMRTFAVSKKVLLLSVLAVAAGSAHANLPDEIDYRTYLSSYTQAKSQSDQARQSASQIRNIINDIVAQLEMNGSSISISRREIEEAIVVVNNLSAQNMDLENLIAQLNAENKGLVGELARLADELDQVQRDVSRVESDLYAPRNTAQNLRRALQSVQQNINVNGDRLDKAVKKMDRNRNQIVTIEKNLKAAIDENDRLQIRLPKLQSEIKESRSSLSLAESKVSSFESQVQQARQEVAAAKAEVTQAQTQVNNVKDKIAAQEQKIGPLVQKKSNIQRELSSAQSTLSQKTTELEKAKSDLESAKSKISSLKTQRDALASQKSNLEQKKGSLESELATVEQTLKDLLADRGNRGNAQKIKNLREQRKILRDKITQTQTRLTKIEGDFNKTSAELAQAQKTISDGETKIAALQGEVDLAKRTVQAKNRELKQVEQEIAQAAPQLEKLKQRLAKLNSDLSAAKSKLASANSTLQAKEQKLAQVKSDITRLRADIAKLQDQIKTANERIAIIQKDVKRLKQDLKREEAEFVASRREVGSLRNTQNALVAERESYERRLSVVESDIRVLTQRLDELHVRQLELSETRDARASHLNENEARISDSNSQIIDNANTISYKRNEMASNEDRINDLERENSALLERKHVKEEAFATADAIASDLEQITDEKLSAYEERKELYGHYKSEAKKLGSSQGTPAGATAGEYKASLDVNEDATFFGKANGVKLGELKGYLAGLLDGKDEGVEAGYNDGVNSQSSYDDGYAKGYEVGVAAAKKLAKSEEFPKGYESVKNDTFSTIPTQKIVLSNSVNGSLFLEKAFSFASSVSESLQEVYDFVTPEYAAFEKQSVASFTSKVDQEVARVRAEIESYETNKERTKALPQYAYTAPTQIDVDEDFRNCYEVYKQVVDFEKACEDSYNSAYKMQFSTSHKDTYFAGYESFFAQARDEAASGNFETSTKKGFDSAYKTAYAEARLEGEGVAYQNGSDDGEEAGFKQNIEQLRAEMLALGKSEATKLFAQSGVVRLNKAAQTTVKTEDPKGLTQDGKFSVGVGLVNFGKLASNRGAISAKVVGTSSNVEVLNLRSNLRVLPAQAQIELGDVIQAKVSNNARPGSEVQMQIELTYPGDALRGSYTEIATFSSNVLVNPEVQVALDFDDEVKDRKCVLGLFNCKFRSHDVKVKLTGMRDFVPGSYDVAISVLEGAKYVELRKAQTQIASPGRGVVAAGEVTYKFKKKTKDDKLKFKVDVSYKGELLKSKVFDVRAK